MLSADNRTILGALARRHGVEPEALCAIVDVESGGRVFARVDGRNEPVIRWEGHYFDRLCAKSVRAKARRAGLASPTPGAVANPAGQAARWALLGRAARLDHAAAYASASWGVGQVMGSHWHALGYDSVDALVAEARDGFAGQARLMLRFIENAGLMPRLAAKDWPAFARGYNGPGFAAAGYDERLASAYRRYCAASGDAGSKSEPATALLVRGSSGEAVKSLQEKLIATGSRLGADGLYGRRTLAAVRRFQEHAGLSVDGVAGPHTLAALDEEARARQSGLFARLISAIQCLFFALSGKRRTT